MKTTLRLFEKQFGPAIANWSFAMMHRQVHAVQKLGVSMMHTARPFAYYRKVFYNRQSEANVLDSLVGKTVVDVGCGYTPYADDSMFRICHDRGIEFYGVDPLIGEDIKFGIKDRALARVLGSRGRFSAQPLGFENAISASAQDLPFQDNSVDELLCSFLLFVWIEDESALADILEEFLRVLKPGGVVKLYPLYQWHRMQFSNPKLNSVLSSFTIEQSFVHGGLDFRVTPAMLTELTKV
ncbi:MAG: SAM-dependent methyltransferase [Cryomorphaceae bacterium]|jgi:SAM-dependent methyltransferase